MTAGPEIIVVDDEPDLRMLLEDYLGMQGFVVRSADGPAALDRALAERPADVIVLDVNMPGGNGFDALARLRAEGLTAGVIMLTAAAAPADRVTGLTGGADDYLVKPFEPRELLARIRSILRRLPPDAAPVPATRRKPPVRMGACSFDADARRLVDAEGAEVELTAMEFDLLSVLARHPRQTLSRSRLAELAHGRPLNPGDRSIDIRITRLRAKLGEDARAPKTLRTVHGEGYVFDPES
jgi:DNA-binding response OmpR family regulator